MRMNSSRDTRGPFSFSFLRHFSMENEDENELKNERKMIQKWTTLSAPIDRAVPPTDRKLRSAE